VKFILGVASVTAMIRYCLMFRCWRPGRQFCWCSWRKTCDPGRFQVSTTLVHSLYTVGYISPGVVAALLLARRN